MRRLLRPSAFPLLLVLVTWLIARVPGYTGFADDDTSFTLGKFLRDVVDPLALLIAVGAALLCGRWRGLRAGARFLVGIEGTESESLAAGKFLAAGARGLLWGAFCLNATYVISFYWPREPGISTGLLAGRTWYVAYGAFLATTLGCLVLLPCAERAVELSAQPASKATRVARATDALALLGLFALTLVLLLSVFLYRFAVIGEEDSGQAWFPPSLDRIDLPFVLWSLLLVFALPWGALFATSGPRALIAHDLRGRLARMSLAAGVLVAMVVEAAGLRYISRTGGQGNPAEVQDLAGRMLVPVGVGIVTAIALAAWRKRSA